MNPERLAELLSAVARGETSVEEAVGNLSRLPFHDLGFAKLDTHRPLRTGHSEVVFGAGKEPEQLAEIVAGLAAAATPVLVTRVTREGRALLEERFQKPGSIPTPAPWSSGRRRRRPGASRCCAPGPRTFR